jgi:hypothetical protein
MDSTKIVVVFLILSSGWLSSLTCNASGWYPFRKTQAVGDTETVNEEAHVDWDMTGHHLVVKDGVPMWVPPVMHTPLKTDPSTKDGGIPKRGSETENESDDTGPEAMGYRLIKKDGVSTWVPYRIRSRVDHDPSTKEDGNSDCSAKNDDRSTIGVSHRDVMTGTNVLFGIMLVFWIVAGCITIIVPRIYEHFVHNSNAMDTSSDHPRSHCASQQPGCVADWKTAKIPRPAHLQSIKTLRLDKYMADCQQRFIYEIQKRFDELTIQELVSKRMEILFRFIKSSKDVDISSDKRDVVLGERQEDEDFFRTEAGQMQIVLFTQYVFQYVHGCGYKVLGQYEYPDSCDPSCITVMPVAHRSYEIVNKVPPFLTHSVRVMLSWDEE